MERTSRSLAVWLSGLLLLCVAAPSWSQEWQGSIGGGYVWEDVNGSEDSYRTQFGEGEGFLLDDLSLSYTSEKDGAERFRLSASGFGNAEPFQQARLVYRPSNDWRIDLGYDRRKDFFSLAQGDLAVRHDQWTLSRWRGSVDWDGWSFAKLGLDLKDYRKTGDVYRPLYGLNEFYWERMELDDTLQEAAFRVETKSLPVKFLFEQSYGVYERKDRWAPESRKNIPGNDPDLLATLGNDREDKQELPTSRLTALYHNANVDLAGSLFYSSSKSKAKGSAWRGWDLNNATAGRVEHIDDLMGVARQDTLSGNFYAGVDFGCGLFGRVRYDFHESDVDSEVMGLRMLRLSHNGNPPYRVIPQEVWDWGIFNATDRRADFELEYRSDRWAIWGGGLFTSREVAWQLYKDQADPHYERHGSGYVFGGSFDLGRRFRASAEYQEGAFEEYVFRTDPKTTYKITLRLRSDLGAGWNADAHYTREHTRSPETWAGVNDRSQSWGASLGWDASSGKAGFALRAEQMSLSTETGLILPQGDPDMSFYNMSSLSLGANGRMRLGPVRLDADFQWLRDNGASWPLRTWMAFAQATLEGPKNTEFSLFARRRSYDEGLADLDDFEATRYGLLVRWRF